MDVVQKVATLRRIRPLDVFYRAWNSIQNDSLRDSLRSIVDPEMAWKYYVEEGVIPSWVTDYCNRALYIHPRNHPHE
jgi:hypothetical protein